MSLATDGFSAMMSFLPMPCERPPMISASSGRFNRRSGSGMCYTRVRARGRSAGQARVRHAEEILGKQSTGARLLVPQHHQHDELQLIERKRVAGSGERALE